MTLFSAAGTLFQIYSGGSWLTVAEVESLGPAGGQWDVLDLREKDDTGESRFMKAGHAQSQMQIVMGLDGSDPGQIALWSAYQADGDAQFRIVFPSGAGTRQFDALVIAMADLINTANEVARVQATLQINSAITRS